MQKIKVWKTSVLYEELHPYNSRYYKKQQITQIDMWEEMIYADDYVSVYKGNLGVVPSDSNPVFVSKTEKEAYKIALEHCRLVEDEPDLMYEFIPMERRSQIHQECFEKYPELMC